MSIIKITLHSLSMKPDSMSDKKPFQSKKFIALVIGITFTVIFTIAALIFIWLVPSASAEIVNLIVVALASVNGCISAYAIGQSAVDWKLNSKTE